MPSRPPRSLIRAPREFVAGLVLALLAAFVIWATWGLPLGTVAQIGPGMFPKWVALGILFAGLVLIAISFAFEDAPLERWGLRGPVFICAAAVAFALSIRTLGLYPAGVLTILIGGFATVEARIGELLLFAIVASGLCTLLFVWLLQLPLPAFVALGF